MWKSRWKFETLSGQWYFQFEKKWYKHGAWINSNATRIQKIAMNNHCSQFGIIQRCHFNGILRWVQLSRLETQPTVTTPLPHSLTKQVINRERKSSLKNEKENFFMMFIDLKFVFFFNSIKCSFLYSSNWFVECEKKKASLIMR